MAKRNCVVVLLVLASACSGSNLPTGPTASTAAPTPAATATSTSAMAFDLTGTVTDDDGTPVANADLTAEFQASVLTFPLIPAPFPTAYGVTDGAGSYRIDFTALPGGMHGPKGTNDAIAFTYLRKMGYESDYRYIRATTPQVTGNVRLYRVRRITAGESTFLTVLPDDTICSNNYQDSHPWAEEFVCRTVRIVAPASGTMTVEAISTQGAARPGLEVETAGISPCCSERMGNPSSIPVAAGTEVVASVEIPWGSASSQSFVLNTSMAPP